jgi:hypothetical protein
MTAETKDICALCKHFKMKEYPDHARVGLGRCMGYDKDIRTLSNPFTPWSTKACVRFRQDWAGTEKRMEWIEKKRSQQHQNNNAVTQK